MKLRTGDLIATLFKRSSKWKNLNDEELRSLKNEMLSIADDFVSVCEKYNLGYFMAYGTALGAVRHKGFIPWDDDMDFYMPREDYERFLKISEKEIGDKYYIRSISKGDKVNISTCHIRKKNTHYVNYGDFVLTTNEPKEMRGIYIDIFPLDNASNNRIIREVQGGICLGIQFLMSCINVKDSIMCLKKLNVKITKNEIKQLNVKRVIGVICGVIPMYKWNKLYDGIVSINKNKHTNYVTCYTGYKSLKKGIYKRSVICGNNTGEFEGRKWKLPNISEQYLRQMYEDYMVLPSEEKQKIHPIFELEFNCLNI